MAGAISVKEDFKVSSVSTVGFGFKVVVGDAAFAERKATWLRLDLSYKLVDFRMDRLGARF